MKAKRLVAMLLSLMLIAGMLPLSASATGNTNDIAKTTVTLMSTSEFGSTKNLKGPDPTGVSEDDVEVTASTFDDYKALFDTVEVSKGKLTMANANTAILNYSGVLAKKAQKSSVDAGSDVYITVKVTSEEANGVIPVNVIVEYDGTAFTPKSTAAVNLLAKNRGAAGNNPRVEVTQDGTYKGKTFSGNLKDSTVTLLTETGTNKNLVIIPYNYNSSEYHAPNATGTDWDYVLPFTALKAGAGSEHEFKVRVYQNGNGASIGGGGMKIVVPDNPVTGNGSAVISSSGYTTFLALENNDDITGVSTFVTITSSDPTPALATTEINPAADQEVTVNLTNGTFTDSVDKTKIHVMDSAGSPVEVSGAVTGVTRVSDTSIKVKIDGSAAAFAGKTSPFKIKIEKDNVKDKNGAAYGSDITTGSGFTIKKEFDATVAVSGTEKYGQTLTATPTAGANVTSVTDNDITYQWQRSGASGYTDISGATSKTYTLTKEDVGKTLKVVIGEKVASGASAQFFGTKDATSGTIGKAQLTLPTAAGKFTGDNAVPTISKDATTLTATDDYTFTDGLVNNADVVTAPYTATYTSSASAGAVSNVTVTFASNLTLGGTDAAYYELSANTGGTITGVAGKVLDQGYKFTAAKSSTATEAPVDAVAIDTTTYTGGAAATITVTSLKPYEQLKSVTSSDSKITTTVTDAANGKFTVTGAVPASGTTVNVTLTVAVEPKKAEIGKTNLTVADTKPYDGNTDPSASLSATIATGKYAADKTNVEIAGTFKYKTKKGGETVLCGYGFSLTGNDAADYYKLSDELKNATEAAPVEFTVTGITQVAITGITVTPATASSATQAGVVAALKNAAVSINGIEEGTLGTVLSKAIDSNWNTVADAAAIAAGAIKTGDAANATSVDVTTANTAALTGAKPGDTITFAAADLGDWIIDSVTGTGVGDTTDTTIATTKDFVDGTITVNLKDKNDPSQTKTLTLTVSGTTAAQADYTKLNNGDKLTVAVTPTQIAAWADADVAKCYNTTESTGAGGAAANTTPISAQVTVSKFTPTPSTGIGVTFETEGYGKVESNYMEADVEGRLAFLPKVEAVKGAAFIGWSLDGVHIVDKDRKYSEDTKLTAVFNGYMVGKEDAKAHPADSIRRDELAKMLVIASGTYDRTKDYGLPTYSDCPSNWATNFIACAEQSGIIHGDGNAANTFRPSDSITREEAAVMIAGAFGVQVSDNATTDKLTDFDQVSDWAKKYVAVLSENGTISGRGDGTFDPKANIRRDEATVMINIYLGLTSERKAEISADTTIKSSFSDVQDRESWNFANIVFASLGAPSKYYGYEIVIPQATK